ncbi:ATP-binding protein [Antarcticibacterium flavum]|uniref:ATP-binding protein n=1 Tax=Antarcticibacterium flavum TaxID=2058175 RepID=A0A5B7X2Z9_9FLAO|nr:MULTISPECIES: ATP-binding protein [Antarcticibacterium]MCM4161890.1 hypothetical protein [Antarcticibacterium sp. W02-3]QCY69051.1 ATP-binding protein [Antarcticibacterium flavum]
MSGFKLYSLEINNKNINTDRVDLINKFSSLSYDNYFTLIVGNNGTGKSRILSEIARFFKEKFNEGRQRSLFTESHFKFNILPSKVITITNSISDKFPIDSSFRPSRLDLNEHLHRNFKYNYLGTRNRFNSFSNKALMNRALEIVFESYSEYDVSRNYRHIFDYLDYEPIIKINYRFRNSTLRNLKTINPSSLIKLVENKNDIENRFTYRNEKLIHLVKERAEEICEFILDRTNFRLGENENEITINFSAKNIGRIRDDNSLYSENVYEYEVINILRKLDIIKNLEIQVFKKGGMPFNFSDASSGEASILSTLLSLIPLLKNDSLILIDEPEISLHPLWQSKYIDLLNKILENVSGCHVIIASHSPFIASDLNPNNSSVITLKNKKGFIKSEAITNSTYGWAAEDILLNVFEMPSTRNFDLYDNVTKALRCIRLAKYIWCKLKINSSLPPKKRWISKPICLS